MPAFFFPPISTNKAGSRWGHYLMITARYYYINYLIITLNNIAIYVIYIITIISSGGQSNGIKRKNSSPAESRMTPFASAAIATVNKIADRSVQDVRQIRIINGCLEDVRRHEKETYTCSLSDFGSRLRFCTCTLR